MASNASKQETDPSRDKRILIVDDSVTVIKRLAKTLKRAGMVPIECQHGLETLAMLEKSRCDLILLDLVMPEISGLDLIANIRKEPAYRSLPIVVITANRETDQLVEALELGADDFVTKPFSDPILLARIRTHLRSWQLLLDLEKMHLDLLQAREQEMDSERWRTAVEMAGAVAHKLNQPLTSIVCYADMLLKKFADGDEEDRLAVERISKESERMASLLRSMAEIANIRSSEYVGGAKIIDLDDTKPEKAADGVIDNPKRRGDRETE